MCTWNKVTEWLCRAAWVGLSAVSKFFPTDKVHFAFFKKVIRAPTPIYTSPLSTDFYVLTLEKSFSFVNVKRPLYGPNTPRACHNHTWSALGHINNDWGRLFINYFFLRHFPIRCLKTTKLPLVMATEMDWIWLSITFEILIDLKVVETFSKFELDVR